jgi:hypothetical protein
MPSASLPRRILSLAAMATTAALGAACGDASMLPSAETMALATRAMRARTWEPTPDEALTLQLEVPPSVKRGDVVPIRVHLHNGTPRPVAVGFGATQGFDVLVARVGQRADSGSVWSPLKMPSTASDVTITDPLQPGRDTTFEVRWPVTDDQGHSVPVGRYRVRAFVAAALLHTREIWTPWTPLEVR